MLCTAGGRHTLFRAVLFGGAEYALPVRVIGHCRYTRTRRFGELLTPNGLPIFIGCRDFVKA